MHETYTFKTLAADMDYLLNKYHNINEEYEPLRRFEYHGGEYDSSTGIDDAEMLAGIDRIVASFGNTPDYNHQILKAKIVKLLKEPPENRSNKSNSPASPVNISANTALLMFGTGIQDPTRNTTSISRVKIILDLISATFHA